MGLVPAPEALEYFQSLRPGGFFHGDRLEAALQSGVLLDIFAVLVDGGSPDDLQLPPAEGRLEDVGGVDGPLGAARPHDGVELVNKENDVPRPADLAQDMLQLLLKFPPILCARHHGGQIQGINSLAQQVLGGVSVGNGNGQPLHHGGLAHARLPDQGGVVLGPPGQYLNQALQLLLPADHRIQPALPRHAGQVPGALVQLTGVAVGTGLRLSGPGLGCGGLLPAQRGGDRPVQPLGLHTAVGQQPGGSAALGAQQAQQQVLRVYRSAAQTAALLHRPLDGHTAVWGEPLVDGAGGHPRSHPLHNGGAQAAAVRARPAQRHGGRAELLSGQPQQQVLAAHIAVAQAGGVLLGQTDGPQRGGCELAVCHVRITSVSSLLPSCPYFQKFSIAFSENCDRMGIPF